MKRLAVALVALCFVLVFSLARAGYAHSLSGNTCTITVTNSTSLSTHLDLAPGAVLCLHGGTYQVSQLQLTASGISTARITLRSYPGEQAILKATGGGGVLRVTGSYWTALNLVIDNSGLTEPAVNIVATADHFELLGSDVLNGTYYGVVVFGPYARLDGNQIHYFRPGSIDTSAAGERHCIEGISSASNLVVRGNTIYDCWGDGIQMYEPDTYKDPSQYAHNVLIENNTFRRGSELVYSSNAIDIKGVVSGTIRNNDIGGYSLPTVPIIHQDQVAVTIHHGAQGLLIENNHLHDNWANIMINSTTGGQLTGVVMRNNDIRNSQDYGINLEGVYTGSLVEYNTLVNVGGGAIQIAGQGLVGSGVDRNLIIASGASRVYSGAIIHNSSIGPNAWFSSSRQDALVNSGDVLGVGNPGTVPGFGNQASSSLMHALYLPIAIH